MSARTYLFLAIAAAWGAAASAQDFHEGWETAQIGDYVPSDASFINGEEGFWFLADSISQSPNCGRTRNEAQILIRGGSRALRLLSNRSFTSCADDIWVVLAEFDSFNRGFGIPLTSNTVISFDEVGELEDPQLHNGGVNCPVPPCFDNVSLILIDNNGNTLAYVLQRYPGAVENVPNVNYGDRYREIFLDPDAGSYSRNLFNDFRLIRTFVSNRAQIRSIEFRVDQHGWAILDNLRIRSGAPAGTVPVHRFWSPVLSSHFYTASESERQTLINVHPDVWIYEGVAFSASPANGGAGLSPVYRFWSPVLESHFYTIDEAERDKLIERYSDVWTPEGVVFYAFEEGAQPEDSLAIYRFWSQSLGAHFYTASEAEKDKLIDRFSNVWTFEGVAWHAFRP